MFNQVLFSEKKKENFHSFTFPDFNNSVPCENLQSGISMCISVFDVTGTLVNYTLRAFTSWFTNRSMVKS